MLILGLKKIKDTKLQISILINSCVYFCPNRGKFILSNVEVKPEAVFTYCNGFATTSRVKRNAPLGEIEKDIFQNKCLIY